MEKEINILSENIEQEITIKTENFGFIPTGTKEIDENGVYGIGQYAYVDVDVPGIIPSGELDISENGTYDVTQYASADVNVPEPTGTINISENGLTNVKNYENANVQVPQPSGQVDITSNGIHNINDYSTANVQVPGIIPSGTKNITSNGTHNVYDYAEAQVNVPEPTGSISITTNGEHNVKDYATANVSVPGIVPTGEISITTNGTHDVTNYASASVSVPSGVTGITDYYQMFYNVHRVDKMQDLVDASGNVTDCESMFYNATNETIAPSTAVNISNFNTSNCSSFKSMFQGNGYWYFTKITGLENLKAQNVTTMENMFSSFMQNTLASMPSGETVLDFSNWGATNKLTSIRNMFYQCGYSSTSGVNNKNITLKMENWDTSGLTDVYQAFMRTRSFTKISLKGWDTSNLSSYNKMFANCYRTTEIDLSTFTCKSGANSGEMFASMGTTMQKLDMRNFEFTNLNNFTNMFQSFRSSCLIIVKDQTQKDWFTTNWPSLTNVQTVEEYES